MNDFINMLENKYDLSIKDTSLLKTAFTQGTYQNDRKTENYQRLEFLGDSIIKASLSEWLYKNLNKDEGDLTKVKSIMEKGDYLSNVGKELGLQKYVLHGDGFSEEDVLGVLDDVYEALVACIFLQNGFQKTSEFIIETCTKNFFEFDHTVYTSEVNEYFQKKYKSEYLNDNHFDFEPCADGQWKCKILDDANVSSATAKNKTMAKEKASKDFYRLFINKG